MVMMSTGAAEGVSRELQPRARKSRTDHVGADEEVVARLRRIKMEKEVGRKEEISVRVLHQSQLRRKMNLLTARTCTPADRRPDTMSLKI
jgi:hypothetical protein